MKNQEHVFEPAKYSTAELRFLLDHLGMPPKAALHKGFPKGVNPAAIHECLGRIYDFIELERHQEVPWAGVDSIKDAISRYLDWSERTAEIHRRGGPRHASMFGWDEGRPTKLAIGADAADMVRSEILEDGTHRQFLVDLRRPFGQVLPSIADVAPWLRTGPREQQLPDTLNIVKDHGVHRLACGICGKSFEYDPVASRGLRMARAAMARHLKTADAKIERHQALLRREFTNR